jgi:hypothetical protein
LCLPYSEASELLREALGGHVFDSFIANKKFERDDERRHSTTASCTAICPYCEHAAASKSVAVIRDQEGA